MFAVVRVDFPTSPAGAAWSDATTRAFLDPAVPFSMAHYWKQATFGQVDMAYQLFPVVTMDDPRPALPADQQRNALANAVLQALEAAAHPDWRRFSWCMAIFSTSGTELAGGGVYRTPGSTDIRMTEFNADSRFDAAAQEVGHSLGLQHEQSPEGAEYGCPWSVMSAMSDRTFERPVDPRLPGTPAPGDPNRTCGPLIPAAHLYLNERRPVNPVSALNTADSVTYVDVAYADTPQRVRLTARDAALAAWPARRPVLAVVPPVAPGGDTYFLELRRGGGGYEAGVGDPRVVVLAGSFWAGGAAVADTSTIRLRHMGVLDVGATSADLDFRAPNGSFVAQLESAAPDRETVDLLISTGSGPQAYGVRLGPPEETRSKPVASDWQTAVVPACSSYVPRAYGYRTLSSVVSQAFTAQALGYERPRFRWSINGKPVRRGAAAADVRVEASCRTFADGVVSAEETRTVTCRCQVRANRLSLTVREPLFSVALTVELTVTGDDAPARTAVVTADCSTLEVEWDDAHQQDKAQCLHDAVQREVGGVTVAGGGPGHRSGEEIQRETLRLLGIGIHHPDGIVTARRGPDDLVHVVTGLGAAMMGVDGPLHR